MPPDPEQAPDEPVPHARPLPGGVARGWRSIGFALIVTGIAGLLFHLNAGTSILRSHLGQISLGLIAIGLVLLLAAVVRHSVRR